MRLLGIDYGSKRVGIALSNEDGDMAFPHTVLQNNDALVEELLKIVDKEAVKKIIIGHSLSGEGNPNPIHEDVSDFIALLTMKLGVPIELMPEQYTTKEAIRIQGKHGKIDASAAAIILNSYITKTKQNTETP